MQPSFSIKIPQGSFVFEGPVNNPDELRASSGVYIVMYQVPGGKLRIIDVGSAKDVRQRLKYHEREIYWRNYSSDKDRFFGVQYCNQQDMRLMEGWLKHHYQPVCGKIKDNVGQ